MTLDCCTGFREAWGHWRDAPMLQQTFEAMARTLEQNNVACIGWVKTVVEVGSGLVNESPKMTVAAIQMAEKTV